MIYSDKFVFACLIHLSTSSPILALAATSSSGSPGSFAYMSTQCDVPKYFVGKVFTGNAFFAFQEKQLKRITYYF